MDGNRNGFDLLDKVGFTILGLIALALVFRSIDDFSNAKSILRAVGGVILLFLPGVWFYAAWRLPARQEGIVTIVFGLLMTGLIIALVPSTLRTVNVSLVAPFVVLFAYGVVRIAAPDITIPPRIGGGALILIGGVITGLGAIGLSLQVGLFGNVQTVIAGVVLIAFGLGFVVRPDIMSRL